MKRRREFGKNWWQLDGIDLEIAESVVILPFSGEAERIIKYETAARRARHQAEQELLNLQDRRRKAHGSSDSEPPSKT